MKQRNYSYDLMRVIACLMIIAMHAPMPSERANSLFLNVVSYFTAPGLCLFFVLSGALLLPVKLDTFTFIKKRLVKVVAPTICFSLLYLGLKFMCGNDIDWFKAICSIPFSAQGHGVMWFMYTLIGLYLLSPILSGWLEKASKREVEFYLLLWGISLCYPIIRLVLDINTSETGLLYYFTGYAGYFILGSYLKKYPDSFPIKGVIIPVIIAVLAPVLCKYFKVTVDFYSLFWYLSIFVTILVVFMYKALQSISRFVESRNGYRGRTLNVLLLVSDLSFGIYLVHIAVMRYFLWKIEWIENISNYYIQWGIIVLLTFAISFLISYVIYCLPIGRYIIGVNKKN